MKQKYKYKTPKSQREANKRWYHKNKEYFKQYQQDHKADCVRNTNKWLDKDGNRERMKAYARQRAKDTYWAKKLKLQKENQ